MIGMSASSHPENGAATVCVLVKFANEPAPNDRPSAMNTTSAATVTAASVLCTMRPESRR
jgi:hypothetical protein